MISKQPSAGAYNALGALFAQEGKVGCAIESFRQSLRLEPAAWETRYNLALALISRQDYRGAVEELQAVTKQKPDFLAGHNALGLALQNVGDLEAAEQEFKEALKINPGFTDAASNLAQICHEQKKYPAEIYYLRQCLAHGPPPDLAYSAQLALGVAYESTRNTEAAIEELRKLVSSYPKSSEAHYNLGIVYAKHVQFQQAKVEFAEALELDPNNEAARLSLAKDMLEIGDDAATLSILQEYTRRAPKDYEGYYELGRAYRLLGDFGKAIPELRRALALKPDRYDVRYNLGLALARVGQLEEAVSQLEIARKLNPQAAEAPYQLSLVLQKKKELGRAEAEAEAFQKARQFGDSQGDAAVLGAKGNDLLMAGDAQGAAVAYRDALKLMANDPKMHYNLSLALEKLGDKVEEKKELETAVQLDPNLAEAHNGLGILAMAGGNNVDAEREFRVASGINPAYAEAEDNLGSLYAQQGKNAEAIPLFQKATADDPKYARGFLNWGMVLAAQGDYAGAIKKFQEAIGIYPNYTDVYLALGEAQSKQGQGPEAVQTFRKLVALQPASSDAHLNLGIVLADQHDLEGALEEFSEAVRRDPNSAIAHYNRGRVFYDLGKRADARVEAETAYRLSPDYPANLYLLGLVEREANNLPLSTEALQKLVSVEPHNSVARFLLGQNLLHLGKQDEAIQQWKAAVRDDPDNIEATYNLAKALGNAKNPEGDVYMAHFEELQNQRQLTDRVQTLNNFALEAARDRNYPRAIGQLKEAIEACAAHCPQLPVLHKNLGLIYARTGEVEQAKQELQIALKLKPGDPDTVKALGVLDGVQDTKANSN